MFNKVINMFDKDIDIFEYLNIMFDNVRQILIRFGIWVIR